MSRTERSVFVRVSDSQMERSSLTSSRPELHFPFGLDCCTWCPAIARADNDACQLRISRPLSMLHLSSSCRLPRKAQLAARARLIFWLVEQRTRQRELSWTAIGTVVQFSVRTNVFLARETNYGLREHSSQLFHRHLKQEERVRNWILTSSVLQMGARRWLRCRRS